MRIMSDKSCRWCGEKGCRGCELQDKILLCLATVGAMACVAAVGLILFLAFQSCGPRG